MCVHRCVSVSVSVIWMGAWGGGVCEYECVTVIVGLMGARCMCIGV